MSSFKDMEPRGRPLVVDLVREAGVDVHDWSNFSRGAKWAAANPKYCYEWSFVEPGRVVVLNLWYSDMKVVDGVIAFQHNARKWEREFSAIPGRSAWAARARKMDAAIQVAFKDALPVRLILLAGERRGESLPTDQASRVKKRRLDDAVWAVTAYDSMTGACIISRGVPAVPLPDEAADDCTPGLAKVTRVAKNVRRQTVAEIYRQALDISFRRSGGLYVVIKNRGNLHPLVRIGDALGDPNRDPHDRQFDSFLIGKRITNIARRVLLDLAAIDGAVVLSNSGEILAYGSVLETRARGAIRKLEGSRTKAAIGASHLGLAVKISSDGDISFFFEGDEYLKV